MKDSGIEWIGEIPEDWGTVRYKEICNIKNGYPFDSDLFSVSEGFPLIRIRDITSGQIETYYTGDYEASFIVRKNDIVVGMDGDFNIRRWDNEDALLNQRCMKIIPNNKVSDSLIYYQLPFQLKTINDLTYATTVKHLSHYDVWNSKFVCPDLLEQQKIANFLDQKVSEIDHILEKTRESIEEYKKYKQSLITEAVTKGLNPDVEMKDSGIEWIGEIPKHWEVARLKNIGICFGGLTYNPNDICNEDEGILVLRSSNVRNGKLDFGDRVYIRMNIPEKLITKKGDILVCSRNGSRNLIGKNALIDEDYGYTFGAFMTIVRTKYHKFVHYFLNSDIFKSQSSLFLTSTVNQLTIGTFNNMNIVIPSDNEQQDIINYLDQKVSEIDSLISQKEALLSDLETYKKSLIYECVTGKREIN